MRGLEGNEGEPRTECVFLACRSILARVIPAFQCLDLPHQSDRFLDVDLIGYPGGAPHTDFVPGQTPQRGVWQVLPVEELDHLAVIGGVMNTGVVRTRLFFRRVMALLDAAAAADANS